MGVNKKKLKKNRAQLPFWDCLSIATQKCTNYQLDEGHITSMELLKLIDGNKFIIPARDLS